MGVPALVTGASQISDTTGVALLPSSEDGFAGMAGLTSYNIVEGEFYLKSLPLPDKQEVKQTIQGITDTFSYENENLAIRSLISENDRVKVTEMTYFGEIRKVMNKTMTAAKVIGGAAINLLITESGIGEYASYGPITGNQKTSTHHELVAIAVEDIRPFLLKSLSSDAEAEFKTTTTALKTTQMPTNDTYIQHLTP